MAGGCVCRRGDCHKCKEDESSQDLIDLRSRKKNEEVVNRVLIFVDTYELHTKWLSYLLICQVYKMRPFVQQKTGSHTFGLEPRIGVCAGRKVEGEGCVKRYFVEIFFFKEWGDVSTFLPG